MEEANLPGLLLPQTQDADDKSDDGDEDSLGYITDEKITLSILTTECPTQ